MNDSKSRNAELHQEFRCLTMLLTLAAAINHKGHPTLVKANDPEASHKSAFDSTLPGHNITLNAVATLLVCNFEVIATTVCEIPHTTKPTLSTSGPGHDSRVPSIHLIALQEKTELADPGIDGSRIDGFTAIANPDTKDQNHFQSADSKEYILNNPGKSHWPSLRTNKWHGFTLS